MYTSIIGYPRVGVARELKFATEKYFKGEISVVKLYEIAQKIKKDQWIFLKEKGIDLIPSNDFSFYDQVLDTAFLFNIIPQRYEELELSWMDTYFAMARGHQGKEGDVKALAMKKWFNTNYHYMVPEIEDSTVVKLAGTKPFEEYLEARQCGIQTKSVIIGGFTLLKLIRYTGKKRAKDYVEDFVRVYVDYLNELEGLGAQWVQFDEPAIVCDLTEEDKDLFYELYREILKRKGNIRILLESYFGDVRDVYDCLIKLPFDGIGLDFIEGKENLSLLNKWGFPKEKLLFLGIVNGKNIWKNRYKNTIKQVKDLEKQDIRVVLSTSCSLLHVPYTIESEEKLSEDYKNHFAFAVEKVKELEEIKQLLQSRNYEETEIFQKNEALFSARLKVTNPLVKKRIMEIEESDFIRIPEFFEREKIQKQEFKFPMFPTTTIGSFPQTLDVKENRKAWKEGKKTREEYCEFNKKKIQECVKLEEELGLDVLVHGEFERNDMVEYFGEQLEGYLFTEKGWVQSYGTRCVKPPIIWGDVYRSHSMTVDWSIYAQSLTDKPMKGMLTGPVTILNWSFPREDISLKECAYQIALAVRDEVLELEEKGIRIIQIDEAALREKLPLRKSDWEKEYLDWAIRAFRLVHSKVKPQTQIHTHMCYSEFTDILKAIDDMDADVITFEASRSDLLILDALKKENFKTEVGPGVYDIHSPRIPSSSEIKKVLLKMLEKVEPEKLWVNPDCGLKTRGNAETIKSLQNMVEAAKELRDEYNRTFS